LALLNGAPPLAAGETHVRGGGGGGLGERRRRVYRHHMALFAEMKIRLCYEPTIRLFPFWPEPDG